MMITIVATDLDGGQIATKDEQSKCQSWCTYLSASSGDVDDELENQDLRYGDLLDSKRVVRQAVAMEVLENILTPYVIGTLIWFEV